MIGFHLQPARPTAPRTAGIDHLCAETRNPQLETAFVTFFTFLHLLFTFFSPFFHPLRTFFHVFSAFFTLHGFAPARVSIDHQIDGLCRFVPLCAGLCRFSAVANSGLRWFEGGGTRSPAAPDLPWFKKKIEKYRIAAMKPARLPVRRRRGAVRRQQQRVGGAGR